MRHATVVTAACLAGLVVGCAAPTRTVRSAHREMMQLSRTARDGDEHSRLAALTYLLYNDRAAEADLLAAALDMDCTDPIVVWRVARTASRDRHLDVLLGHAITLLKLDPDGPYTELAWRLVASNREEIQGLGAWLDGVDAAALPANPMTRDLLLALLQERLAELGRRSEAAPIIADRGYLTTWTVTGPAGADPVTDFCGMPMLDVAQGREVSLDLPYVPLTQTRSGGGVYDAWTDIDIERTGRYLITASSTASIRVEVDGLAVITLDRWAEYADRQRHAAVTLDEGPHRLRARMGTDLARGSFTVRISELPGEAAVLEPQTDLDAVPGGAVQQLREALGASPGDPELRLDLILAEALEGVNFLGRGDAVALVVELPFSAECQRRAGQSIMGDSSLTEETRRRLGLDHLRQAVGLDPGLVAVATALAQRMRTQDDEDTRDALDDIVRQRPDLVDAHLELAARYQSLSWEREAEGSLQAALERAPTRVDVLQELSGWHATRGEQVDAHRYMQLEIAAVGEPFGHRRADLLEELGRLGEAEQELAALQVLDPHDEYVVKERVRLLRAMDEKEAAEALLSSASVTFPNRPWPWVQLSALALAQGHRDEALAQLDRALLLEPQDIELRKQRWRLGGETRTWLSGDPSPAEYDAANPEGLVRDAIEAFEANPGETAAYPAVVLLDRREIEVLPGGASLFRLHRAVRLQDRAAVDAFAEVTPGNAELITVRTWRPDGVVVDADPPAEKDAYSLRDLVAGCTVEVQGLAGGPSAPGGEDGSYVGPEILLSPGGEYLRRSEVVYLLPPGTPYEVRGTAAPTETTLLDDGTIRLRWLMEDLAPPDPEPFTPTAAEYLPWLQVMAWTDLAETARPLTSHQAAATRNDPGIEALAARLAVHDDPRDTIFAVVNHVRHNVRIPDDGGVGMEAVDVLATGSGAYEPAVVALLEAAGIPADWVRVRPSYLPDLGEQTRVATDYPESLVRVPLEDADVWIDLTGPYVPVGWLHPAVRGAELLGVGDLTRDLPDHTPTPAGDLPGIRADVELVVDEQGDAAGVMRLEIFQQSDALLREEMWSVSAADRQQIFEGWLAEAQPGITVLAVQAHSLDDPEGPVVLQLDIAISNLFHAAADGTLETPQFFPDLLPPIDGQAPTLAQMVLGGPRNAPFLVWPYHESLRIQLSGPGLRGRTFHGWDPIAMRSPLIEVTRTRDLTPRSATLTRETSCRLGRVAPQDYPELRDLLAAVASSARMPVRLVE